MPSDTDAEKWIRIFTFLQPEQIESLIAAHQSNPGARELQKALAKEVTCFVHGNDEFEKAVETTAKLFAAQDKPVESMSIDDLEGLEGVIKYEYDLEKITSGIDVVSFLAETGILPSKGEARKMVQNGGISINRQKVSEISMQLTDKHLLQQAYILVQKGKKNYYLVREYNEGNSEVGSRESEKSKIKQTENLEMQN
jgi:tyrosyl-tRNA synthetase